MGISSNLNFWTEKYILIFIHLFIIDDIPSITTENTTHAKLAVELYTASIRGAYRATYRNGDM